jgi:hypothetical protein
MLLFKIRDQILYLYTKSKPKLTLKFKIQDIRPPKLHSIHNIGPNEKGCGKTKETMVR